MIYYAETPDGIDPRHLHGFFVGWPQPPSPETHLRILQNSRYVVLAIDDSTDDVVGFITAVSDGVLSAYIPLLEVLPEFQGRGIGRELVRRMLDQLKNLYMIDLTCDQNLQKFYSQFSMQPYTGMMIRNFTRQAGI